MRTNEEVAAIAVLMIGGGFVSGHMVSQEAADDMLQQFMEKLGLTDYLTKEVKDELQAWRAREP